MAELPSSQLDTLPTHPTQTASDLCALHGNVVQYRFQDENISLKREKKLLVTELVRLRRKNRVMPINICHNTSVADSVCLSALADE